MDIGWQNIVHNMNNMTVTCFDIIINDDRTTIDIILVGDPQHRRRWTFGLRIITVHHFKFGQTDEILVPDRTYRNMKQDNIGNYIILE